MPAAARSRRLPRPDAGGRPPRRRPRAAAARRSGRRRRPAGSAARRSSPSGAPAGRAGRRPDRPARSGRRCRRCAGTTGTAPGRRGGPASPNTSAAGPVSTTRPAYITATRSQTSASTARSWLMSTMPTPRSATSPVIRSRICACTMTSSAVVGSSATISRGRQASAIAIITRCRCPPESWCGYDDARPGGSPTWSSSSATRSSIASSPTSSSWSRIGSAIWAPTRRTGLSECSAPWKTIEASAQRTARRSPQLMVRTSAPLTRTSPETAASLGCSRSTVLTRVDLPQPDSPATPSTSPACTTRSTPRSAGSSPSEVR